jgi:predicted RNase H-like HicB family nuclease
MIYTIIYEGEPGSYGAYIPDLPGCVAVGETIEEVRQLIHEAIELHLSSLREHGEPIPPPTSFAETIEIAA